MDRQRDTPPVRLANLEATSEIEPIFPLAKIKIGGFVYFPCGKQCSWQAPWAEMSRHPREAFLR